MDVNIFDLVYKNYVTKCSDMEGEIKMESTIKTNKNAIPCRVVQMSDFEYSPIGCAPCIPEFRIEACPKTVNQARALFAMMQKGEILSLSVEYKDFSLDREPKIPHLAPTKIIHSGPATIVFWNDKTKTVVRCSENDIYDEYAAFCAALAIKMYGNNSHLKKMIEKVTKE